MAERVFTTLGHWVTLDDDALDAAIREVGIAHPDAHLRKRRTRAVRLRAGDAGRAEGADHPRAVHAAAAAIPVRGQCAGAVCRARRSRPERDDGARQSQGVPGGLAQSRQRHRPRAPDGDGERRRCHVQGRGARGVPSAAITSWPGRTRPAAREAAAAQISAALGVSASDRIEDVEREIVDGPNLPRSRWQEIATVWKPAARPIRNRRRGCARRWRLPALAQVDEYLGVFLTEPIARPRKSVVTKNFVRQTIPRSAG